MKEQNKDDKVIFINKIKIRVIEDELTVREIAERAGLNPGEYDLFLPGGQNCDPLKPDDIIPIKNGLHFRALLKVVPYG